METSDVLDELVALARDAGLTVRGVRGGSRGDLDVATASAVCRVRGETWVVLADADPMARRIAVLAGALREHAPSLLEERYLPPAVRHWIDAGG